MGFVISLMTAQQTQERVSNAEYLLMMYSSQLTQLAMQSQAIVQEQAAAGQAYMAQHRDEEGVVDISAVEYVNSAAFTAKWDAKLRAIQAKEQVLSMLKKQAENEIAAGNSANESWGKVLDKNTTNIFGYGR